MFEDIKGSTAVFVGGREIMVPCREDYIAHLRWQGFLDSNNDLADHPELAEAVYRCWQHRPQVACAFARMIAENPAAFGVRTMVVQGPIEVVEADSVARTAASFVEEVVAQSDGEAASIILPGLNSPAALVAFCRALSEQAGWTLRAHLNPSDRLRRVYVELKREVGKGVLSEALGFAPFDFLPLTRRAPVTAVELRTKPEPARHPKSPFQKARVHLAAIPVKGLRKSDFEEAWKKSENSRLEVLGGDDSAARARVTFAIPHELWQTGSGEPIKQEGEAP